MSNARCNGWRESLIRWQIRRILGLAEPRAPVAGAVGYASLPISVTPASAETAVDAYLETGFVVLDPDCGTSGSVLFTAAIADWTAARIGAGHFSLVGSGTFQTAGSLLYPPFLAMAGADFSSGSPTEFADNCLLSGYSVPPSSVWSGGLMPLWVQAQYGARTVGLSPSAPFAITVGGATVTNTAAQSHWIYLFSGQDRLEFWAVEATSGGALKFGRLGLDSIGALLRDYLRDNLASIVGEERAWLLAWTFRGAAWPTDWITASLTLPSVTGLGYGWHVSESGALASAYSYATATSGAHVGLDWTRHDLTIGLTYVDGAPVWNAGVEDVAVGYLETNSSSPIVVWRMTSGGQPAWLLTNPGAVTPLASNAEVWGWYEGEAWAGVRVRDTGVVSHTWNRTPCGGGGDCAGPLSFEYIGVCGTGTASANYRSVSVGAVTLDIDPNQTRTSYNYYFGESESVERQPGPINYGNLCSHNTPPYPTCPDNHDWEMSGTKSYGFRDSSAVNPSKERGAVALIVPYGVCDAYVTSLYEDNAASITAVQLQTSTGLGSPLKIFGPDWHIYYKCHYGENEEQRQLDYSPSPKPGPSHSPSGYTYAYPAYGHTVYSHTAATTRKAVTSRLHHAGGSLALFSADVGTTISATGDTAARFQSGNPGTLDAGGYQYYYAPLVSDPTPITLTARRSAHYQVIDALEKPSSSAARISTDDSLPTPIPGGALWVGAA